MDLLPTAAFVAAVAAIIFLRHLYVESMAEQTPEETYPRIYAEPVEAAPTCDEAPPREATRVDNPAPSPAGENPKDRIGTTKPPLHLIPASANILESMAMGLGAAKYGAFNWRTAKVRASVYIAATLRHLSQFWDGCDPDPESGISHLAHARASIGILIDAFCTDNVFDDRPPPGPAADLIKCLTTKVAPTPEAATV